MENLEPAGVWRHFAAICAIPRPSLHEAALRAHIAEWAKGKGIASFVDRAGNLILKKPASKGAESMPGVILQGHLDMVCQANSGTRHDFERDPIETVAKDGWVVAEDTTLGADNGIGVALALAALEEPGLRHPAIEVLLTVNEESGMDGARGLEPGTLEGRLLINMDSEEWGHFYLGCAGGVDVEVFEHFGLEEGAAGECFRLDVGGLQGGHSGIDIHLGRGNAIRLLAEAVNFLSECADLRLVGIYGGTARNAIPREAHAVFSVREAAGMADRVAGKNAEWRRRFAGADPNVSLTLTPCQSNGEKCISGSDRLTGFLCTVPDGVSAMSEDFPGVVETSSNLGVAGLEDGLFRATFKVRSLADENRDRLADELIAHARYFGFSAEKKGAYPGWTPDPASPLLELLQHVYVAKFGAKASLQVIHAGLECGLLSASHPHLDMISFGPDIRGAHAPGERVEIGSVARCWELLKAALQALSSPAGR